MQQNKRPLIIGITGSIGSGKSTFCKFISRKYKVYSADKFAHQAILRKAVIDKLKQRWGSKILQGTKPDRDLIAQIVFNNKEEINFLNSIIHPIVLEKMQRLVEKCSESVIFFEIPLLFEAHLKDSFDHIITIVSSLEIRIKRIISRDNLTSSEIYSRLQNQLKDEIKISQADTIIINNDGLIQLEEQAKTLLKKIKTFQYRKVTPFVITK
jgi:dephospho-CoA kinase